MPNKGLLLFALLILLVVVSLRSVVKIMEPKFIFQPKTGLELNPKFFGLDFVDVFIQSGDFKIHGWFFPGDRSKPLTIFYHGNAGNMADRLDFARFIKPLGLNFLMIDYRGYGRSQGKPSIEGIEEDAVAAVAWAHGKRKVPLNRIVLWGRSLGVAAALAAAQRYPGVSGLILESGFVSMRRMAAEIFPILPAGLVTDGFDNGRLVSKLSTPKLFIHGTEDDLIPFSHAEELYARSLKPKWIVPIARAGHNDTYIRGGSKYLDAINQWITMISVKPATK